MGNIAKQHYKPAILGKTTTWMSEKCHRRLEWIDRDNLSSNTWLCS